MRDAQSAFDQVISFAGEKITKEDVEMALGIAGADILIRVVNGIANNQPSEALAVVEGVVMRGHDLRNFCRDLLAHFRDLLVTKVSGSEELLESAICDSAELRRQAALFSEADLVRFFHSLAETEVQLKEAAHPRYQVEIGLVKLMEMRRLEPLAQLVERLSALEDSTRSGKPLASTKTPAPTTSGPTGDTKGPSSKGTTAAGAAAAPMTGSFTGTAAKTALEVDSEIESEMSAQPSIIGEISAVGTTVFASTSDSAAANSEIEQIKSALEKRRKMFLATALEGASYAAIDRGELSIEFAPEAKHLRDTLAKSENVKILREACQEVTGRDLGVRINIKDQQAGEIPVSKEEAERREKQRLREQAEANPIVQQMLRTFRGEIVDVRRVKSE
jgi:DNA polymerase-3 subunit gamma/tau